MSKVYNIIEVANVHAGDFNYLKNMITEFSDLKSVSGIKFQPFKYDKIATPDFSWYEVYKELFFNEQQWEEAINEASKFYDIWIDTFDDYSYDIIKNNIDKVKGMKFQSSILFNKNLINKFQNIDLSEKLVILNISGIELDQIEGIINDFKQNLKPKEIILQVGFQGYPTEVKDNGLNKIKILQHAFDYRISFADHIDCESNDSLVLPVVASLYGATIIEKHICLSGEKPKYDFYSSLYKEKYIQYLELQNSYLQLVDQPYINDKERVYLSSTIQIPQLVKSLNAGQLPNKLIDFEYKRTSKTGLRTNEIQEYLNGFHVLANDKNCGDTLTAQDFKKANIAVIIACRLKSSRLPKKALLKIGELSSVEYCIKSALAFKNVNLTVLATSDLEEDAELANHTYSKQVLFHKGHPLDVIERYLDVINSMKIDTIIRITADMPFVSNDILELLLKSHFETGADYTKAKKAAIGTNLEIINAEALRRVKSNFPSADYSEYMTYYFTNNPEHFKLNEIDLPEELVRDYRLTLDYDEDLTLFNNIINYLDENKQERTLKNIFSYLDANPEVAKINSGLEVKYLTDKTLVDRLNQYTKIK